MISGFIGNKTTRRGLPKLTDKNITGGEGSIGDVNIFLLKIFCNLIVFMNDIVTVIDEILKFSSTILDIYEAADDKIIDAFEKRHKVCLPNDYKILLRKTNGLNLMGNIIYGVNNEPKPCFWISV